jgi:hypothetical protein
MQKHLPLLSYLFICLLSFNFLACSKEVVKSYSTFPIDINVEQLSNGFYKFSWTGINTSDFKEYWIIRRINDTVPFINANNVELLRNSESMVIAKINDANNTTFIDTLKLFGGKSFVRVFAFLENRALSSVNKELNGLDNIFEKNRNSDNITFDKGSNLFYSFDSKLKQLSSINAFTFNSEKASFTNFDIRKELYFFENKIFMQLYIPNVFNAYDIIVLPNLNIVSADNFFSQSISMIIGRDSFVVTSGLNNTLISKDRVKFFINFPNTIFIKQLNKLNPPPILRWNKSDNEVLSLTVSDSAAILNVVSLASNGTLTFKMNLSLNLKSKKALTTPFFLTPKNSYILLDEQGLILESKTLANKGTLSDRTKVKDIKYIDFAFSTDEKFVCALRESKQTSDKKIDIFDYPSFDYVKSISFKSNPKRMFYHDNKLKLVGESPNNVDFTMYEVINP